ncbi:MGMT family protein [Marinobacteraceae bacterium S3BR75-40.1]
MADDSPGIDPREQAIWQVVHSIPPGRVATYGQIARLAALPGLARFVGRTLSRLPEGNSLPWHRVINAQGKISFPPHSTGAQEQTERLRAEGVEVRNGRISLARYGWEP